MSPLHLIAEESLLQLFFSWAVLAIILVGLGHALRRAFAALEGGKPSPLSPFWLGWASLLLYLQVHHLFRPVDKTSWILPVIGATAGWWQHLAGERPPEERLYRWINLTVLLGFAIFLSKVMSSEVTHGDSGAYHLPFSQWASRYRLVPGLANLNPLFGLQGSHFLFVAFCRAVPWLAEPQRSVPGLLLLGLIAELAGGFLRVVSPQGRRDPVAQLVVLTLAVLVEQLLGNDLVSASADLAVAVMESVVLWALADWLWTLGRGEAPAAIEVLMLAMAGTTLKLSFWVLGFSVLGLMIGISAIHRMNTRMMLAWVGGLVLGGPGVWSFRSIIVSGYPAFPYHRASVAVPWRVPLTSTQQIEDYVRAWGRMSGGAPEQLMTRWGWVGPWLESAALDNRRFVVPVALAVGAGVLGLLRRPPPAGSGVHRMILVPLGLSIAFWFCTSPDFRFGGHLLWLLAATAVVLSLERLSRSPTLTLAVVVGISAVELAPLRDLRLPPPCRAQATAESPRSTFTTESGLKVQVPRNGLCGDAAPPCTWMTSRWLRARDPNDLAAGFETAPGHALDLNNPDAPLQIPNYR